MIATGISPRPLTADQKGGAIVEFAMIAPVMLLLLIGGLDMAHQSYVRTLLQGALNDAARKAAVEDPIFSSSGDTLEEKIEESVRRIVGSPAVGSEIKVTQESFFDFSSIGNPEKLMRDNNSNGAFDESEGDCYEDANINGEYDTDTGASGRGSANDVVFYTANVKMPRLFPTHAFMPVSPDVEMTIETAVRNQPYGERPTPPVICGATT